VRIEGWESRLAAAVEEAKGKTFSYGKFDCVLFVMDVARDLTGKDFLEGLGIRGKYKTKAEAAKLIVKLGGKGGFKGAVTKAIGIKPKPPEFGSRGDVMMYRSSTPENHLGICIGSKVAIPSEKGLLFIDLLDCTCCWNI